MSGNDFGERVDIFVVNGIFLLAKGTPFMNKYKQIKER